MPGRPARRSASSTSTGASLSWTSRVGPAAGRAAVYLDGRAEPVVDLYAPDQQWQSRQGWTGLAAGPHRLVLRVLGTRSSAATGAAVVLDAVTATGPTAAGGP